MYQYGHKCTPDSGPGVMRRLSSNALLCHRHVVWPRALSLSLLCSSAVKFHHPCSNPESSYINSCLASKQGLDSVHGEDRCIQSTLAVALIHSSPAGSQWLMQCSCREVISLGWGRSGRDRVLARISKAKHEAKGYQPAFCIKSFPPVKDCQTAPS